MARPHLQLRFARSPVLRYGLAAASFASGLGLALLAERSGFRDVEVPLFLFAIAASVWYGGIGPAILAVVLSSLAFDYFFTEPRYSFYVRSSELPYYAVFILFASLLTWFSAVRRRIEQQLLQSRDELQREVVRRTEQDATRAADIISRISVLFKKGALQRELADVNELIREMIVLLRSEANRYSLSIRPELAQDLPKVMADRVQLQQVFMNLMLNGIDAMKETTGGGELIIKSEAGDCELLISVSDTGVGLPPEQAEQIFKAFFTTKDSGTGMGLPISRSIIEPHGGRLWAAGASGRGATFHFTLPATLVAHA